MVMKWQSGTIHVTLDSPIFRSKAVGAWPTESFLWLQTQYEQVKPVDSADRPFIQLMALQTDALGLKSNHLQTPHVPAQATAPSAGRSWGNKEGRVGHVRAQVPGKSPVRRRVWLFWNPFCCFSDLISITSHQVGGVTCIFLSQSRANV